MSLKVLAGFAAALVVTTVGVFAANGGSFGSMLGSSSSCGTCPLSAMTATTTASCCSTSTADDLTVPVSTVNPDAFGAFGGGVTAGATPATCAAGKTCCSDE